MRPKPVQETGKAPPDHPPARNLEGPAASPNSDPRFGPYCDIYKNLDALKWQNLATLLAVTAFGMNAIIAVAKEHDPLLFGISNQSTAGLLLLVLGLLYTVVLFSMARVRHHFEMMNDHLAQLDPAGYFAARASGRRLWLSGSAWSIAVFGLFAALCAIAGIVELDRGHWLYR